MKANRILGLMPIFAMALGFTSYMKCEGDILSPTIENRASFSGVVKDSISSPRLKFVFYTGYYGDDWTEDKEEFEVATTKPVITLDHKMKKEYGYVHYYFPETKQQYPTFSKTLSLFLIRPGDAINFSVEKGTIQFSGIGAIRLNCQKEMLEKSYEKSESEYALLNTHHYIEYYELFFKKIDSSLRNQLQVLESYRSKLSPADFNIIRSDCYARSGLNELWEFDDVINGRLKLNPEEKKRWSALVKSRMDGYIHSYDQRELYNLLESAIYCQYLYEKELKTCQLDDLNDLKSPSLAKRTLDKINLNYAWIIRDKVISIFFIEMLKRPYYHAENLLADGLTKVKTSPYRGIVESLNKAYGTGMQAYDFSLSDTSGKKINLHDFRGKIVVLDFWFTGCLPCMALARNMHLITSHFKDEKRVVFLTVNTDKSIETWKKSVLSGKYADERTLNLYTDGLGEQHPLLKFYNFNGFPQLLIINEDGTTLSTSPPRPSTVLNFQQMKMENGGFARPDENEPLSESSKAFIKIIEDGLKKMPK